MVGCVESGPGRGWIETSTRPRLRKRARRSACQPGPTLQALRLLRAIRPASSCDREAVVAEIRAARRAETAASVMLTERFCLRRGNLHPPATLGVVPRPARDERGAAGAHVGHAAAQPRPSGRRRHARGTSDPARTDGLHATTSRSSSAQPLRSTDRSARSAKPTSSVRLDRRSAVRRTKVLGQPPNTSMTTVANPRTPGRPASRNAHQLQQQPKVHIIINLAPLTTAPPYGRRCREEPADPDAASH